MVNVSQNRSRTVGDKRLPTIMIWITAKNQPGDLIILIAYYMVENTAVFHKSIPSFQLSGYVVGGVSLKDF